MAPYGRRTLRQSDVVGRCSTTTTGFSLRTEVYPASRSLGTTLLRLAVIGCVIGSSVATASSTGSRCRFSREWRGRYFQSGLGEIYIRENAITTKGECVDHSRDYFLFYHRENNCFHCLLLLRQHRNIIQYKESYCSSQSMLKVVCAQIRVESPLYTLVRDPAKPVRCPFEGAFQFTYNDLLSGFCERRALSYARPCIRHTRYQLRFNHCVDSAIFNRHNVELECLATWKDGSETYLYGQLTGAELSGKNERYRCFKHQQYGAVVSLAMSADATCRGLRSATDGPFLIEFNKDAFGWPAPSCQFPDWLKGVTWRDLSGQYDYNVDDDAEVFSEYRRRTSRRRRTTLLTEFRCIRVWRLAGTSTNDEDYAILSFTHHNCAAKRQCLKLRRLSNNAVQLHQGRWLERDANDHCFVDDYGRGQVLVAANATHEPCPRPGVHHTVLGRHGCLHRLNVGCHNASTIIVDNSCPNRGEQGRELSCVTSWQQNGRDFVIARQEQQDSGDSLTCFSFRQEGGVTLFGTDVTCYDNVTSLTSDAILRYSLQRYDRCKGGNHRDDSNKIIHVVHRPSTDVATPPSDVTSRHDDDTDADEDRDSFSGEDSGGRGRHSVNPWRPTSSVWYQSASEREDSRRDLPEVDSTSNVNRKWQRPSAPVSPTSGAEVKASGEFWMHLTVLSSALTAHFTASARYV